MRIYDQRCTRFQFMCTYAHMYICANVFVCLQHTNCSPAAATTSTTPLQPRRLAIPSTTGGCKLRRAKIDNFVDEQLGERPRQLIEQMLQVDPTRRPQAAALLTHWQALKSKFIVGS
eukprot:GHVS01005942.1.p2 GENE.GHVS01005942.1~~GHVS01005942.1.p2  ORF type:complete len:117 (+),score=15.95 GHVS01005942.1:649-999(+)